MGSDPLSGQGADHVDDSVVTRHRTLDHIGKDNRHPLVEHKIGDTGLGFGVESILF